MSLMLGQFQAQGRGKGPGAGLGGGGRGSLRRRLGGDPGSLELLETGKKLFWKGGHVHFCLSDLSSVKRGGGASLLPPPPPTHSALALPRPAQGPARRLRATSQRGCPVQRDRGEGPGVTAPPPARDPPQSKQGGSKRAQSWAAAVARNEKWISFRFPVAPRVEEKEVKGETAQCTIDGSGRLRSSEPAASSPGPFPRGAERGPPTALCLHTPPPPPAPAQVPAAPGVCWDLSCFPCPTPGQS